VKTFKGHSQEINCIDISADNTLLASRSLNETARIWNLDTCKLVAGPFKSESWVGAIRFSPDSKKLAVKSLGGRCLEVWDVKLSRLGLTGRSISGTFASILDKQQQSTMAAFSFSEYHYATSV
jgi:WD40 repeat protein